MTNHIEIRDRRAAVLGKYPGLQVGKNGILGDYRNSFASLASFLEFINESGDNQDKFDRNIDSLQVALVNIGEYSEWELLSREMAEMKSLKDDPEIIELLLESEDVKPIIQAIDENAKKLNEIGEELLGMTKEQWGEQGEEISERITELIEKQKQLMTLGIQDEVAESVDDIKAQVFGIMHLDGVEFQEVLDRGSSYHMMANSDLSNIVLSELGIQVGDTIARQAGDNTFDYRVKGVAYFENHSPYPQHREIASGDFIEALRDGNKVRIVLCFSDSKYPDNHYMSKLGNIVSEDKENGVFLVDGNTDFRYMKI